MGEGIKLLPEELRKLQLIELDLLLELDRICKKNNITYMICSGTLLGAVRHKGFIPWDDDLDTRMPRKEFEKFEKACEKDLNHDKYFLQTWKTDPEYRWGYVKLRRKGTEYLRAGQEAIKCMSGVSIDIFVADNVSDNYLEARLQYYIRRACIKTLWSVIGVTADKNPIKRGLYRVIRHIPKTVPLKILEGIGKRNNRKSTKYACCLSFYRRNSFSSVNNYKCGDKGFVVLNDWFKEKTEIEFEGFKFYTCANPMEYLQSHYVNIWSYPPENERTLHAPISFQLDVEIDLHGKSIDEYMKKDYIYLTKEEWEESNKTI